MHDDPHRPMDGSGRTECHEAPAGARGGWPAPPITDLLPPRWAAYTTLLDADPSTLHTDGPDPEAIPCHVHDATLDLGRLRRDDPESWQAWVERWRPDDPTRVVHVIAYTTTSGKILRVEFPGTTRTVAFYPYDPASVADLIRPA